MIWRMNLMTVRASKTEFHLCNGANKFQRPRAIVRCRILSAAELETLAGESRVKNMESSPISCLPVSCTGQLEVLQNLGP